MLEKTKHVSVSSVPSVFSLVAFPPPVASVYHPENSLIHSAASRFHSLSSFFHSLSSVVHSLS